MYKELCEVMSYGKGVSLLIALTHEIQIPESASVQCEIDDLD